MRVWVEAARPRTLPAAIVPVVVGTATAGEVVWWRFGAALVVSLALQVAVNYANDYFDGVRGVDTPDRVGPRRMVAAGLVAPSSMKVAIAIALATAGAAGVALTVAVGPELLLVGVASVLAALAYSGGPRPYASAGLGEVFVFLFFGPVATIGTAYVHVQEVPLVTALVSIPVGLLATAILVVNNLRDISTDAAAGKRTLAVRLGRRGTLRLYAGLFLVSALSLIPIAFALPEYVRVFPLVSWFGAALALIRDVYRADPADLVRCLWMTSVFHLVFGVGAALMLWR